MTCATKGANHGAHLYRGDCVALPKDQYRIRKGVPELRPPRQASAPKSPPNTPFGSAASFSGAPFEAINAPVPASMTLSAASASEHVEELAHSIASASAPAPDVTTLEEVMKELKQMRISMAEMTSAIKELQTSASLLESRVHTLEVF